ncbi:MAG: glycosyltransferase family 2 protein [Thermoplasmata archaeon]|nr:glycosyltransferase family 2 protein [Thermoplasmata archaeon]
MDPFAPWVIVLLAGGILALVAQGWALVLALGMPRLDLPSPPGPTGRPAVSVIVAARNEEIDLPGCLDGLLGQDYPNLEIIVVDGGSSDRTREVALSRGPKVRLLDEPPLPPGWVGKNWACDIGYRAASGEYLLFTDADVRYHPAAVRRTVEWALSENAPLATLAPRVEMVGFWEKLVMPFYIQMVLTYFRTPRVNSDRSSAAMANGQYLLVRRAEYEAIDGHAGIRGAVLEDVALARSFRTAGHRMRVAWAPDLLSTRMYRDRHEMFEGLLKNIHGTEFSVVRQVGFILGVVGIFLAPLALLPLGILWGNLPLAVEGAFLYLLLFGKHILFNRGILGPASYGLLFPVSASYYVVLLTTSLVRGMAGRPVEWKGRSYPLVRTRAPPPGNG